MYKTAATKGKKGKETKLKQKKKTVSPIQLSNVPPLSYLYVYSKSYHSLFSLLVMIINYRFNRSGRVEKIQTLSFYCAHAVDTIHIELFSLLVG